MKPCCFQVGVALERRPANALCVEIMQPMTRCTLKKPSHWPESASVLRWLGSGGSPLVLGICSARCPLENDDGEV